MGETDSLPTARESMVRAVAAAESGRFELAQTWVAIARELREGARPAAPPQMPGKARQVPAPRPFERDGSDVQRLDFGQRYEDEPKLMTRPHDDPSAAVIGDPDNDADTMYGYTRGQQRPPSQTAYAAAVRTRKQLDRGEGPYSGSVVADVSSLVDEILTRAPKASHDDTVTAINAFGADGLQRIADVLHGLPETSDERERRFAYAPPARPYVDPETTFAGFARGEQDHTRVLSGGRPGECRNCGHAIYEVTPSDLGTSHRFRHEGTGQAMCPTPPRHTNEAGEETYVTGQHLYAEPGGLPYRAE